MSMKTFALLPILAFAATAHAQGSSDWKKSSLSPLSFAKSLDAKIFTVKDAWGRGVYRCDMKRGKGQAVVEVRIRDRRNFRIDTVVTNPAAVDPFQSEMVVGAKGQFYVLSKVDKLRKLAPAKDPGFGATMGVVKAWPLHFQEMLFQPLITGKGIYTPFVQGLLKGDGGYTIRMDKRTLNGNGQSIPQARLYAVRKPALAKKIGSSVIEIIVDSQLWLPLQITVTEESPTHVKSFFQWTTAWQGPQAFPDSLFKTPHISKVKVGG